MSWKYSRGRSVKLGSGRRSKQRGNNLFGRTATVKRLQRGEKAAGKSRAKAVKGEVNKTFWNSVYQHHFLEPAR